jgi:hypothetical protein
MKPTWKILIVGAVIISAISIVCIPKYYYWNLAISPLIDYRNRVGHAIATWVGQNYLWVVGIFISLTASSTFFLVTQWQRKKEKQEKLEENFRSFFEE